MTSNGSIVECGDVRLAVDHWAAAGSEGVAGFFLTHLHGDHTSGLDDTWARGKIYCSPATAELLATKWPGLAGRTIPLEPWQPAVLVLAPGKPVTVTPLEARHCVVSSSLPASLSPPPGTSQRQASPLSPPEHLHTSADWRRAP